MPRLVIDDLEIEVPHGTKVIDAAERLGIMIPRFCYLKSLGAVGACRMCAVKFVQGPFKGVQMSCMIDAQDDMVVSTTDEEAVAFRQRVIEWLMLNHPHDCPVCDEGGQCLLQDETVSGGHGIRRYKGKKRTYRDQYLGVFIAHEMNRCIHCYRCSRFYQEYSGYRDLGVMQIGDRVYFGRFRDGQLESPFSGNLVDICPTGVYTDIPARYKVRRWDLERSPSICIHCSLGCNTIANARYRTVWRVEGRLNETVNKEFICDRGRFGFPYTNRPERPRRARIDSRETDWAEAIQAAAEKLGDIQRTAGPNAIAALGSARSSLETQAMLKRFCRMRKWPAPRYFLNHRLEKKVKEAAARLDERVAVSMPEVADADFVLTVGTDLINEAPMLAVAVRQAFRKEAPIVAIDPRPYFLPMSYTHVFVPPRELNGCLSLLVKKAISAEEMGRLGSPAREFFEALPADYACEPDTWNRLSRVLPGLQKSRRPVILCGTEIVSEGTPSLAADLALLLKEAKGHCGLIYVMPGANAFGAALFSSSDKPGFMDVVESMEKGSVKALLIVENDPFLHFPDRHRLEEALERLDLLVVLDYLPSRTAERAHILLPTSTIFEAGSSFMNQEGRVQFAEPVHRGGIPMFELTGGAHPPRVYGRHIPGGDPKAGWEVLAELAQAMQTPKMTWAAGPWSFVCQESPAFSGLEGVRHPIDGIRVIPKESREKAFSTEVRSSSGREPQDSLELLLVDWTFGTEELSAGSDTIRKVEPEPHVWMQGQDARRLGLSHDEMIVIHLDGGPLEVRLKVSEFMARGILVLPRHHRLGWQKLKGFSVRVLFDRIQRQPGNTIPSPAGS